ncbi:hypothetical protein F3Y22_tig00116995pilonHSYRG00180 [Hibiscus syriacus]|uniref:Uncharacterized protein n=1 Tax=Hibiscus syriacus TaxID=106335 RepID=A0A6A2WGA4_HIBSY|nr:hypothetical protein F3Y22_tig00116995pilonHSYRG00180 [Hibiscus syriacus]
MTSMKAEKPVGTQLFGQVKKEAPTSKATDASSKAAASKPVARKAAQKPQESKKTAAKKGKGGKAAAKQ